MNALIPTLVAVLLAEIGGPLAALAIKRAAFVAFAIGLLVTFAVGAGWSLAPVMTASARTLLLGIALLFAGVGQVWRSRLAKDTLVGTGLTVWRSSAPFLAFGFAAWIGEPFGPALGAIAGVVAAAGITASGIAVPPFARSIAGIVLCAIGTATALSGLRLI